MSLDAQLPQSSRERVKRISERVGFLLYVPKERPSIVATQNLITASQLSDKDFAVLYEEGFFHDQDFSELGKLLILKSDRKIELVGKLTDYNEGGIIAEYLNERKQKIFVNDVLRKSGTPYHPDAYTGDYHIWTREIFG